jgi:hypothetical protein
MAMTTDDGRQGDPKRITTKVKGPMGSDLILYRRAIRLYVYSTHPKKIEEKE